MTRHAQQTQQTHRAAAGSHATQGAAQSAPSAAASQPAAQSDFGAMLGQQIRQEIEAAARADQQGVNAAARGHPGTMIGQPGNGVIVVPPNQYLPLIPPQVEDLGLAFFAMVAVIIVGLPISRAFGRRIDRRPLPTPVDAGTAAQLQRIENTVESMSIEIERISEAQRFMARLQGVQTPEPAALPADANRR